MLDLATGEGFGANLLAERAARVTGVDIDPAIVAHAAARYVRANLEFSEGAAEAVPIHGTQIFDIVVSFETVEHLDEWRQAGFASEIKRLLKPDGQLVVSTPNTLTYTDQPAFHNAFHRHEFYRDEFVGFLSASFRYIHLFGQRCYPGSFI